MSIERKFIGWKDPALAAAVRLLAARYRRDRVWDLSHVVVVVPGGRAQRHFLELLVAYAEGRTLNDGSPPLPETGEKEGIECEKTWEKREDRPSPLLLTPPEVVTMGALPDLLSASSQPKLSPLVSALARIKALEQMPVERLESLYTRLPAKEDPIGRLKLADELEALDNELEGEGITYSDVIKALEKEGLPKDIQRWKTLSSLNDLYLKILEDMNLSRRSKAWRHLLEQGTSHLSLELFLIAVPDAPKIVREMCLRTAESNPVFSVIQAPETHKEGFDALGFLKTDYWTKTALSFEADHWRIAGSESEQAYEILDALHEFKRRYRSDQITIGVGHAESMPTLARILERGGLRVHPSLGRPLAHTSPALLLGALADFLDGRRVEHFNALVRHPDLEFYLSEVATKRHAELRGYRAKWLKSLDAYTQDHLPLSIAEDWPALMSEDARLVRALAAAVEALLPKAISVSRSLSEWSPIIADFLSDVYGRRVLESTREGDVEIIACLEAVGDILREFRSPLVHRLSVGIYPLTTVLRLVLSRLRGHAAAPPSRRGAVEMLGWLELMSDDAPLLMITGLNEGILPEPMHSSPFLSERMRRRLDMADGRRRYARDLYVFRTLLESRESVRLFSARKGSDGSPLLPSRLLVMDDASTVARRILRFFAPRPEAIRLPAIPGVPRFAVPPPSKEIEPLETISVTGIKDYLACPYRFYLRHVLRLKALDDSAPEMDARLFGILAHDVLKTFGENPLRHSEDPEQIYNLLDTFLEQEVKNRFGKNRRPAIDIQIHQLRFRLARFASWQAERVKQGWRIEHVEQKAEFVFEKAQGRLTLIGRLDRIDRHVNGVWQILDYKLSDSVVTPDKRHRRKRVGEEEYEWVDLQLPLYRRLARALGLRGPISLAYISLSRETDRPELLQEAEWDEEILADADRKTDEIVEKILQGIYWPPNPDPPVFSEEFAGISMDRCIEGGHLNPLFEEDDNRKMKALFPMTGDGEDNGAQQR